MFVLLGDQSLRWSSFHLNGPQIQMGCIAHWLFQDAKAWGNKPCRTLSLLFPEAKGPVGQAPSTIRPPTLDVNYTPCLTRKGGQLTHVGSLTGCSKSRSFNSLTNQSTLSVGRADVWWYCRGLLLETLPGHWAGTCAVVQLAIPFILALGSLAHATTSRNRRDIAMILTKKGGVCVMNRVSSCTHRLTNTAPDESVAKTLRGLTTLTS
jgi:hypothetical protein